MLQRIDHDLTVLDTWRLLANIRKRASNRQGNNDVHVVGKDMATFLPPERIQDFDAVPRSYNQRNTTIASIQDLKNSPNVFGGYPALSSPLNPPSPEQLTVA